ncbi:MAG: hypothetical protein LUQ09_02190 [Methanomassiliicoccales archaeon]|nr:hypothetical protein [Methanomassiliicoccales archaeon]
MEDNVWTCSGKCEDWNFRSIKGMGWRIAFSALSLMLWFAFTVGWLFFLADDYSLAQNIGVMLGSVLLFIGVNVPVWYTFAMKMEKLEQISVKGHKREWASGLMGILWVTGAAIWLMFYAGDYSIYQNLAVLLLSIVPVAAISMLMKR